MCLCVCVSVSVSVCEWIQFKIQFKIVLYNSIKLYSAFYDTIVAKQLYRKLRFCNRFIYCRNVIHLTYGNIWLILLIHSMCEWTCLFYTLGVLEFHPIIAVYFFCIVADL